NENGHNNNDRNNNVETVTLNKKGNSLNLTIVPGGAAEDDGRLKAGDQILSVDKIIIE
ncbi:unnamed protein product, partial [Rotaria sp. Silwood1]